MDLIPFEIRKLIFSLLPATFSDTQTVVGSFAILYPFISSRCVLHYRMNGKILFVSGQEFEVPSA